MKAALFASIVALLCLSGCRAGLRAQEPAAAPTPSPTPTPAPLLAVTGCAGDSRFLDMLRSISDSAACDFLYLDGDGAASLEPEGRTALILCFGEDAPEPALLERLSARGVALYLYAMRGEALPEGYAGLRYAHEKAAAGALEQALAYDNHDTPVRLIGLFSAEDSASAAAWAAAVSEGRVFDRGAHYAEGAKKPADEWLSGRLAALHAGMLDGIYCESAELARLAAEQLAAQGRTDLELFCAEADGALLDAMQAEGPYIVRALGADPQEAGRLCAEQAIVLLYGGTAQTLVIEPSVFAAP